MPRMTLATIIAAAMLLGGMLPPRSSRADDVTVTVSRGTLRIKGDADANKLTLDQDGLAATQMRITGNGTTIDGAPGPVVRDVTGGVRIDLGDGDDELTLASVAVAGAVKIKMGAGDDIVAVNGGTCGDAVSIDLGSGDNALALCDGSVAGALAIKMGAGAGNSNLVFCDFDTFASAHGSAIVIAGLDVTGRFSLKGSKRNESIKLTGVTLGDKATVALRGGTDSLAVCATDVTGALGVRMGKGVAGTNARASCGGPGDPVGENAVALENGTVGESLALRMGASNDSALVAMSLIGEDAKLDLGQGANTLVVGGGIGQSLTVKCGRNGDLVQVENATIGENATVSAGGGNNDVAFFTTTVGGKLLVKTGNGDDTIDTSGATAGESKIIRHGRGNDTVTE